MAKRGGKRSAFLYLEFLAGSVAGGNIFKMDVTHQKMTQSALESGKLFGTSNFANMDIFQWYALNDNVMGGVSNGNVTKNDENNLNFWGKLSSENRGGFASCRTEIKTGLLDGYIGLSFMARGDNREYSALVTPYQQNSGVNYQLKFVAPKEWTRIDIPFDQMYMSIRGFHPPGYPKIKYIRLGCSLLIKTSATSSILKLNQSPDL